MYAKFARQSLPCAGDTIAEGIAVKAPGMLTAGIINQLVDDILLVPERDIERAISLLVEAEKTVAEGAGATGLAALLAYPDRFRGRTVGLVLTGGNIDTHLLANVLLRDLARSGRMTRLRIQLQDRPGALAAVMKLFDDAPGQHRRGLSPARLHQPAGQGRGDRRRVRGARRRPARAPHRSARRPGLQGPPGRDRIAPTVPHAVTSIHDCGPAVPS